MKVLPVPDSTWIETVRSLLHYYCPPVESSAPGVAAGVVAIVVGLICAFRTVRVAQWLTCLFGALVGAAIGYRLSLVLDTPPPISSAVGAILIGVVTFRTYRFWLAIGSVAAISTAAMAYQLGAQGDLRRLLPEKNTTSSQATPTTIHLATPSEQMRNLYPRQREQLVRFWNNCVAEVRTWGLRGWLVPAVGITIGVLLAIWALRIVAVLWIALAGAALAVSGASWLMMMASPKVQEDLFRRPDLLLGTTAALWIGGLIWQAKNARFGPGKPTKSARTEANA